MATQYYNLPTITPATVANGPDAINGLANATDAALHNVEAMIPESADISEISAKADAASVNAQAALNSATAANNTAAQATQTAGAAVTTANAAQSAATANAAAITALDNRTDALEAMLNFTQFTEVSSPARVGIYNYSTEAYLGTGASGATATRTSGTVNVATTATGEYFKVYGRESVRINGTLATNEMPVVGFPLNSVGLATPTEVIGINNAGLGFYFANSTLELQADSVILHTDGYMYLECARMHPGSANTNYFFPCIFQAKQFGDTPEA